MPNERLSYRHVDVFAEEPFSGNGLTVFPFLGDLPAGQMQALTIEMRQFESIFLSPDPELRRAGARVFTMEEELPFAGHPALGAVSVLHERFCPNEDQSVWTLVFPAGESTLTVTANGDRYQVVMDQGSPEFAAAPASGDVAAVLDSLSLSIDDLDPGAPSQVISTGLPYLIVPVHRNIDRARIRSAEFESQLAELGAEFVYVLDTRAREGRTWDNAGLVEDIATGSAAGPAAAFLVANGLAESNEWFEIEQGRFAGRPSTIHVRVSCTDRQINGVEIKGSVVPIARGTLDTV